ncbi:hypothetical protein M427DRAFT_311755 [Gonapodya prolifera JEL478]|uniref:Telomerase activating protein Est1-like N-terminal domain-containing protein n=1 Tax=Gonapodya prolifera (strain JEL478) TaxID=1344416 RepID=A0A139AWK7_GONPJ|nr:hypothetical protein M427DRAFT_311755 [Gonapodya prolifera JEL478]|eukprot:KXS21122.1 hypothetical protein M427DRAFT_311755 [Gonapodya prolifera JEL478]
MGDDRTKINATAVLRDIAREEAALKDFETRARAGGQGRKGGSGEDGALAQQIYDSRCILEALYEDVILSDPHTADMRGIEDRLWTVVFYARVDELRAVIKSKRSNPTTATLLLHDHIAHASAFYQLLIHSVRTRAAIQGDMHSLVRAAVDRFVRDLPAQTQTASASTIAIAIAQPASSLPASTPSPPHQHIMAVASRQQRHPHDLALDTIHRSLIYLGDLARYRLLTPLPSPGPGAPAAPTPLADRDWYVPRALYRRALLVKPGSAKACAQLAIVAGYGGVDWDVAYWNAVGATMPHAPTQARDNLKAFYLNNGQRLIDLSNGEMSEDGAVSRLLNVHRALVYYNLTPAEEIRLLHDSASPALDHLVLTTTPDTVYDRAMALKKVLVPLLLAVGELSARFKVESPKSLSSKPSATSNP